MTQFLIVFYPFELNLWFFSDSNNIFLKKLLMTTTTIIIRRILKIINLDLTPQSNPSFRGLAPLIIIKIIILIIKLNLSDLNYYSF